MHQKIPLNNVVVNKVVTLHFFYNRRTSKIIVSKYVINEKCLINLPIGKDLL